MGISEDATIEEVEAAYKALRKQFHPDAKPAAYRAYFDDAMKGINEAHDELRNPARRRKYDVKLRTLRSQQREKHPGTKHSRGDKKAPDEPRGSRRQSRGRARAAGEEARMEEIWRDAEERDARWEEQWERWEAREETRGREERREAERHASRRLSDLELYVSLLRMYGRYLDSYEDLLDQIERALTEQYPFYHRQCDDALAEGLTYIWVRGNPAEERRLRRQYAETKRTLYQRGTDIRLQCKRGPRGYARKCRRCSASWTPWRGAPSACRRRYAPSCARSREASSGGRQCGEHRRGRFPLTAFLPPRKTLQWNRRATIPRLMMMMMAG